MSGHCRDCRWFEVEAERERGFSGTCGRPDQAGALFGAMSADPYCEAFVNVSADFGCIQFEVRR